MAFMAFAHSPHDAGLGLGPDRPGDPTISEELEPALQRSHFLERCRYSPSRAIHGAPIHFFANQRKAIRQSVDRPSNGGFGLFVPSRSRRHNGLWPDKPSGVEHGPVRFSLLGNSSDQFNRGKGGPWTIDTGLGDTQIYLKYRPIVQDHDGWRPSVITFNMMVLPTSRWATGTESPPGGFAPLGRLPASRFGALTWTEGILVRKNLEPFRISAGVFYPYYLPGSDGGQNTYASDIVNTRVIIEHILDDKRGFGYNLEFVGFHGLPFRADGHEINVGGRHGFTSLGVQPTIQYRLGEHFVGAFGCLFTVAGQNTQDAIYPNFSLYYWSKSGSVIMR